MILFRDKRPKSASILLTTRCNGRCGICKIWMLAPNEIEFKEALKTIIDLKSFGVDTINLLGGEPLLYERLFDLADFIKSQNIRCTLITNGLLIGPDNIKDIKKSFDYVSVSVDGSSKEVYEKIRNGASFDKALDGLILVKQSAIPCDMRYTIQNKNLDDISNAVSLAERLGINILLGFVENRGVGNARDEICKKVDAKKLIEQISRIKSPFLLTHKRTFEVIANRLSGKPTRFKCNSPYNYIFIFTTQDVYPCSVIDEKMGNLRENRISDIYFSTKFRQIRKSITKGNSEICKNCVHGCEINASIMGWR